MILILSILRNIITIVSACQRFHPNKAHDSLGRKAEYLGKGSGAKTMKLFEPEKQFFPGVKGIPPAGRRHRKDPAGADSIRLETGAVVGAEEGAIRSQSVEADDSRLIKHHLPPDNLPSFFQLGRGQIAGAVGDPLHRVGHSDSKSNQLPIILRFQRKRDQAALVEHRPEEILGTGIIMPHFCRIGAGIDPHENNVEAPFQDIGKGDKRGR